MIRLTLLLLAAIAVTMVVAGRGPGMTTERARADPPIQVARADSDPTALPENRLALDDEAGAVARAVAATNAAAAAEPEPAAAETEPAAATPAAANAWYVTGSRVNLRAGPSTATAVVGQVREGQRAEVLGATPDGWMEIRVLDSGETAYIFGRFLAERPAG